jgi:hypothetical protein
MASKKKSAKKSAKKKVIPKKGIKATKSPGAPAGGFGYSGPTKAGPRKAVNLFVKAKPITELAEPSLKSDGGGDDLEFRVYCLTEGAYMDNWTTKDQANQDAQPCLDDNHKIRIDQKQS